MSVLEKSIYDTVVWKKKTNINMRSVIDISYISLIPDSPTLNDKTIKTIMAVLH